MNIVRSVKKTNIRSKPSKKYNLEYNGGDEGEQRESVEKVYSIIDLVNTGQDCRKRIRKKKEKKKKKKKKTKTKTRKRRSKKEKEKKKREKREKM